MVAVRRLRARARAAQPPRGTSWVLSDVPAVAPPVTLRLPGTTGTKRYAQILYRSRFDSNRAGIPFPTPLSGDHAAPSHLRLDAHQRTEPPRRRQRRDAAGLGASLWLAQAPAYRG